MIVLIPVETASRELLYKLYLGMSLVQNGMECYVGSKAKINYLINKFNSFIYFDKGYQKNKSDLIYQDIKKNGGIIVSLDEEGGVDYSDNKTLKIRYSPELFQQVEKVFLWGRYQFKLLENSITRNKNISITGHPRFELLSTRFNKLYDREVNLIKKAFGSFILINTNMGFGNNIRGDDWVKDVYSKWYPNISDIMNYDKIKTSSYLKLISKLAHNYDGKIILRPHPEEKLSTYKDRISNLSNVSVINKGSAVPYIVASEMMIHPDCTTAIEAAITGMKPISYLPGNPSPDLYTHLPVKISHSINQDDDLSKILNGDIGTQLNHQDEEILNDYFSFSKPSTNLISEAIKDIVENKNIRTINSLNIFHKVRLHYLSIRFKANWSKSAKLTKKKLSSFSKVNVMNLVEDIKKFELEFQKIKVEKVASMLYKMSSK